MPKVIGSGCKSSSEWNEVVKDKDGKKLLCKHCGKEVSGKIERIRAHLKKCNIREVPEMVDTENVDSLACSSANNLDSEGPSCSSPKIGAKKNQGSLINFVHSTSPEQKAVFDKAIAKFFFAANIPFNAAELDDFKHVFSLIRPGYEPPHSKQIGGKLLDDVANEVEQNLKIQLKDSCITLIQDGWSNCKNDPIIANSIFTGNDSYLLNVAEGGTEKKTASNCFKNIVKSIELIKNNFNKDVFAVVTDNENKQKKMKTLINERYPDIICIGCSAHLMNLVEKEVTPITIMKHIVEVQKYFRNHHLPHGWVKEKHGLMPQLPNSTRWNSHPQCIKTFVANYHKYREIYTEHIVDFDESIAKILNNAHIFHQALELEKQLNYIANALDKLQSDSCPLSQAVEIWLDVLNNEDLQAYRCHFQKRFDEAMTPVHFLANLMDPRFKGKRLNKQQMEEAEAWVTSNKPSHLVLVLALSINDPDYYPPSLLQDNIIQAFSPSKWWLMLEKKAGSCKDFKIPPDACLFYAHLLSVPSSSASIERIFSTFGIV